MSGWMDGCRGDHSLAQFFTLEVLRVQCCMFQLHYCANRSITTRILEVDVVEPPGRMCDYFSLNYYPQLHF